jgi:hypothetical protein
LELTDVKASIGFSIPVTRMFAASTVWKGITYSILMIIGKLMCGIWLLPISLPRINLVKSVLQSLHIRQKLSSSTPHSKSRSHPDVPPTLSPEPRNPGSSTESVEKTRKPNDSANPSTPTPLPDQQATPSKPRSLYPSAILGLAMVARGEVAFLIASIAQSQGIFDGIPDLYLIVMWAAVLCTITGPLGVGTLVRRVKALEKKREEGGSGVGVLGAWGVGGLEGVVAHAAG